LALVLSEKDRMQGVIRKLVPERGFGFIKPDGGGTDVFMHCTALPNKGDFDTLVEGQRVEFTSGDGRDGRTKAVDVKVL
jgi:cold shock protein